MSMKKGRFTEEEKVFVKQNYLMMSDQQMADTLKRNKTSIVNFRRTNELEKGGKSASAENFDQDSVREQFISALPEEDKKKELLHSLRASSQYRTIIKSLDKSEVQFYEDRFLDFMMDPTIETMTTTEKDALHRKTLAEIRVHRFMEDEKGFRESGNPQNKAREIKDLNDVIFQCEKSLNVTREQRLKDGQDQSINFTSIVKELQDPRLKQEVGYEAAMFKWMQRVAFNEEIGKTIHAGDDSKFDLEEDFLNPDDAKKFDADFLGLKEKDQDDE